MPYSMDTAPSSSPWKNQRPIVISQEIYMAFHWQDFSRERQMEEILTRGKKCKFGNACTSNSENKNKTTLFLSVYVDDIRMVGDNRSSAPMWETLRKNIDLEDPTPSTAPKREQPMTKNRSKQKQTCRTAQKVSGWSYAMNGHAEKRVERYCKLASKCSRRARSASLTINWRKKRC